MRPNQSADPATTWAIRVSIAVVFVLTGLDKFLPGPGAFWIGVFNQIGFGQWFRYFTGIIEIVGGLMFLVPFATTVGAAILAATMVGAMLTQAIVLKHPGNAFFPALYLGAVVAAYFKLRSSNSNG